MTERMVMAKIRNSKKPGYLMVKVREVWREYAEEIDVDGRKYHYHEAGNYNIVYKSDDEPREVYKELFFAEDATDLPERAVRLWNEINPTMPARLPLNGDGWGWIAPFVDGTLPSDDEICDALIDIYARTGRIIVDAFVINNFKKMSDGTIICIDIGAALQLETRLEKEKKQSQVSLDFWYHGNNGNGMKKTYDEYAFPKYEYDDRYSKIINMTKALIYLKMHRPDEKNLDALKTNVDLIETLASAYTENLLPEELPDIDQYFEIKIAREELISISLPSETEALIATNPLLNVAEALKLPDKKMMENPVMENLAQENPRPNDPAFDTFKKEMIKKIEGYIKIAHGGHWGITGLFRTTTMTQKKIDDAKALIGKIQDSKNTEEIGLRLIYSKKRNEAIQKQIHKNDYFLGTSRYGECLSDCAKKVSKHSQTHPRNLKQGEIYP